MSTYSNNYNFACSPSDYIELNNEEVQGFIERIKPIEHVEWSMATVHDSPQYFITDSLPDTNPCHDPITKKELLEAIHEPVTTEEKIAHHSPKKPVFRKIINTMSGGEIDRLTDNEAISIINPATGMHVVGIIEHQSYSTGPVTKNVFITIRIPSMGLVKHTTKSILAFSSGVTIANMLRAKKYEIV